MTFVDYRLIRTELAGSSIHFLFDDVESLDSLILQINQLIEIIYKVNEFMETNCKDYKDSI